MELISGHLFLWETTIHHSRQVNSKSIRIVNSLPIFESHVAQVGKGQKDMGVKIRRDSCMVRKNEASGAKGFSAYF